ncbi:MAG: TolC family protein [Candidatus Eremiobacteraeota bacterium]|nr:TolC family protein [Candidatus Eremiobacteraeota bacterium]MBC5822884.1 TolC family protein [Candidatus Eremiobacteraeota bacterium]
MHKRRFVVALLAAMLPSMAVSAQAPLTLDAALRAVTTPAAADALTPGLAVAASARPEGLLSLQTGASVAPDVGVPAKYTLSQQLSFDVGSRAGRLGRARSAQAAAAQVLASLATSRRSAAQNAVAAFFAVAADQVQFASASQNVTLGQRTLRATTQRRRVGVAPRVDVDRARAALRSSEADLAAAAAALEADRGALGELLSRTVAGNVALPDIGTLPTSARVRDEALQRNPLIASARAELRNAQAALLIAQSDLAPGLGVGAGAAITGDSVQNTLGPVVSATLTLPISTNAARAARGAAQARVAAADVALNQARRDAVATALRLRAQAVSAAARLAPLRDAVESAQRVAESTLGGYRLGAVSSADLVAAQTQLVAARAALGAATLQASQAYASLQVEIGDLPS